MSLDAILTQVATIETTIAGINHAHDKAPMTLNELPAFVNWWYDGDIERRLSLEIRTHKLKLQLFVIKTDQVTAETDLRPFLELVLAAFDAKLTLNSSCANSRITHYTAGAMQYGGSLYLGISFDMLATEWVGVNFVA